MGIRFRCHLCGAELHVKDHQAGKRGRCPDCQGSFRVPLRDADYSLRPDDRSQLLESKSVGGVSKASETPPSKLLEQDQLPETIPLGQPQSESTHSELASGQPLPPPPPPPAPPQAIANAPLVNWYVRPVSGGQYGPATSPVLWQWLQEKRVSPDSLVWREGWPEWQAASVVFHEYFPVVLPDTTALPQNSGVTAAAMTIAPPGSSVSMPPSNSAANFAPEVLTAGVPQRGLGGRLREDRKVRRRRRYVVLIVSLILVLLLLVVGLIFVLWMQK